MACYKRIVARLPNIFIIERFWFIKSLLFSITITAKDYLFKWYVIISFAKHDRV